MAQKTDATAKAPRPVPRPHRMTVADLRAQIADMPDWAEVAVLSGGSEYEPPEETDPYLSYAQGLLLIEPA
ncbi:hypothetical protein ACFY1V_31655 [Streptomyces sp. NPDC001255]|uniref:hypothetical protein n=1 Tax=Streptomyces sp. NPDC001255 TaxID=3364550 RepID=UPI0036CF4782